jgi:Zinc knuckle
MHIITLTDQEREQLRKIGGCFFCRGVGHMARDCPRKKKKPSVNAVETTETESREESEKDIAQ